MNADTKQLQQVISKATALADTRLDTTIKERWAMACANPHLHWDTERMYVLQIIGRSDYLADTVLKNPGTLITAVQDAAAMGLSFAPTLGHAYLIPQRPSAKLPAEVICKVSYKGMEQCVLRSGVITSIVTDLVYANDVFKRGVTMDGPYMNYEPANGDRGDLIGGFCLARYSNGDKMLEWMPVEEINACEAAATKAANGTTPPSWRGGFKPEMQKKCVVRRAQKHWPTSPVLEKLAASFDRESPMVFEGESIELMNDAQIAELEQALSILPEEQRAYWMKMIAQTEGKDSIRDLPAACFEDIKQRLTTRLDRLVEAAREKQAKTQQATEQATGESDGCTNPESRQTEAGAADQLHGQHDHAPDREVVGEPAPENVERDGGGVRGPNRRRKAVRTRT